MAITSNCAKFLLLCKKSGVSFENALMLGRMEMYATKEDIESHAKHLQVPMEDLSHQKLKDKYSEPFFKVLGAQTIDSLDFSDYEGASIIHDLNKPVPEALKGKYTMVFDGGTIEHVFNFPVCIANSMNMLKVGGHFIGITPCNNLMGHGFYQFSPELYYRIFSEENGFKVKEMFVGANNANNEIETWYKVSDPKSIRERLVLVNDSPTYLLILAEKISDKIPFSLPPQQSDYSNTWANRGSETIEGAAVDSMGKQYYRKLLPLRLRVFLRNLYDLFYKEKVTTRDLGNIDPKHFSKYDV